MPHAFVTGSTGFLGLNLVRELLDHGWTVTGMVRGSSNTRLLSEWGTALAVADIRNPALVANALPPDADVIFHTAADTSTDRSRRKKQWAINVKGTEAILAAAKARGIPRFVHTSTVAVFGHHKVPVTEKSEKRGKKSWVGYAKSKAAAEERVLAAAGDGLNATVLNPGHIVGRYDRQNWARLFFKVRDGGLPGLPPGGGAFSNVREVARAHRLAAEKGGPGENYLLGGPYADFADVIRLIGGLVRKPVPGRVTPGAVLKAVARAGQWLEPLTGKSPPLTPEEAYFLTHKERIDSSKAVKALGYREVSIEQSFRECHQWLAHEGLLRLPQSPSEN